MNEEVEILDEKKDCNCNCKCKNKKCGSVITIIILILVILGLAGYIAYDKGWIFKEKEQQENTSKETKKEEKVENLDVTSKEVTALFSSVTHGLNNYCGVDIYFTNEKVTTDNIDNDLASSILLYNLYKSGVKFDEGSTITKKQVTDTITKLFGKKYNYTHNNIRNCPSVSYNAETEMYTVGPAGCGGTCGPTNMKKVVKATKTDSKIEIYVRMLFIDNYNNATKKNNYDFIKYYSDYNKTKVADLERDYTNIPYEYDTNYQKGSLYKMTFIFEDNNYVFTSSEPVKE